MDHHVEHGESQRVFARELSERQDNTALERAGPGERGRGLVDRRCQRALVVVTEHIAEERGELLVGDGALVERDREHGRPGGNVVDQIAHLVVRARGRVVELVGSGAVDQPSELGGRGLNACEEIHGRHPRTGVRAGSDRGPGSANSSVVYFDTRVRGSQSRGRRPALCQRMSRNCAASSTFGHTDGRSVARWLPASTSTPSVPTRRLRATSFHDRARTGVRRESTETLIVITSKSATVTAGRRGSANAALHAFLATLATSDSVASSVPMQPSSASPRSRVTKVAAAWSRTRSPLGSWTSGRPSPRSSAWPIESDAMRSSARRCSSSSGYAVTPRSLMARTPDRCGHDGPAASHRGWATTRPRGRRATTR